LVWTQNLKKGGYMKLYRQTARFILFGLVIALMVFGIQTAAVAGSGPEPKDCKPTVEGAKSRYVSQPYIVDFTAIYPPGGINTSLEFTTTRGGPNACTKTAIRYADYFYADFNQETSKEWLKTHCLDNILSYGGGLFCNMVSDQDPLEVIAIASYTKVGTPETGVTVIARLIVMEVTFILK
jgi:hypothetical protein